MNPEFKRNLWQEFSLQRLIAMPIILFGLFYVCYLNKGYIGIIHGGLGLLFILLVIWGSLAADAIFQEIREHTWDSQRMTPLKPWSMAWGKWLGSTSFIWYGSLWCLAAIFLGTLLEKAHPSLEYEPLAFIKTILVLMTGIFTQTFALFTALLFQRISLFKSRVRVVLIQLFSIGIGFLFLGYSAIFITPNQTQLWYSFTIPFHYVMIGSQIFVCAFLVFGIYRLLRLELQLKNLPWALPLFLILTFFYILGFFRFEFLEKVFVNLNLTEFKFIVCCLLAYGLFTKATFISAFFTPKNIQFYFRWIMSIREKKLYQMLTLTPVWIITLICTLAILLVLILFSPVVLHNLEAPEYQVLLGASIAEFFLLLRDIGLLYYLTFDYRAKRAHLAVVVYLFVLYFLLPILLSFTTIPGHWLLALLPSPVWLNYGMHMTVAEVALVNSLIFLQAFIAWWLVGLRWRAAKKQLA